MIPTLCFQTAVIVVCLNHGDIQVLATRWSLWNQHGENLKILYRGNFGRHKIWWCQPNALFFNLV